MANSRHSTKVPPKGLDSTPGTRRWVRPSFLRIAPEKKPRTECCCHPVCFMIAAIVVPCGRLNSATTLACLEPARDRRDLPRPFSRGLAGAVVGLRPLPEGGGGV